ncbi:unnamed protein product [Echinostoma caproni]|uniref:PA28_alpha domain-containing protein n=1 Tax=Echinostoma caproni TaxID=27848 RepID=A0A182ZZA4_9TREM|nr:unnamed protein product [Echinostoma caproni]
MSNEESRLNEYKEKTKIDGEELVRNVFPKRVFEMEGILASELFSLDPEKVYSEVNIPYPQVRSSKILNSSGDLHHTNALNEDQPMVMEKSRYGVLPYGPVPYNRCIKAMIETNGIQFVLGRVGGVRVARIQAHHATDH